MKRITPKRVALFVGVMSAVALVIYLPTYERGQRQAQVMLQRQQAMEEKAVAQAAAQNAAAEHAKFLDRYVDSTFTKRPGVQTVALSVIADDGKPNHAILDALTRRFQSDTVQMLPVFFKPPFVSDGLFKSAFDGSDDVSRKLDLAKSLDEMLLARTAVQYSTNGADVENVITAVVRLEVAVIPVAGNGQSRMWTFTANGAGFKPGDARAMAEERLIKQIANDRKMSL